LAALVLHAAHAMTRGSEVRERLVALYATKAAYDVKDAAQHCQNAGRR